MRCFGFPSFKGSFDFSSFREALASLFFMRKRLDYLLKNMQKNDIHTNDGIVIRRRPYKENSLIFTIFMREKGLLSFLERGAFGATKSKTSAFAEPTNLVRITYYSKPDRELSSPKRIVLVHEYIELKEDYSIFLEIAKVLKDIERFIPVNETSPRIYDKLKILLNGLEAGREFQSGLTWFYREFLRELGVLPDFTFCSRCGSSDGLHILQTGYVVCESCLKANDNILEADSRILELLNSPKIDASPVLIANTFQLLMHYRKRLI